MLRRQTNNSRQISCTQCRHHVAHFKIIRKKTSKCVLFASASACMWVSFFNIVHLSLTLWAWAFLLYDKACDTSLVLLLSPSSSLLLSLLLMSLLYISGSMTLWLYTPWAFWKEAQRKSEREIRGNLMLKWILWKNRSPLYLRSIKWIGKWEKEEMTSKISWKCDKKSVVCSTKRNEQK